MRYFLPAVLVSSVATFFLIKAISKIGIMDIPDSSRKFHGRAVPLVGGVAIFLSFWVVAGYIALRTDLFGKNLNPGHLFGVFLGSSLLIAVGIFDDKYKISPRWRILATALSACFAIYGGVGIDKITNPMGGAFSFSADGAFGGMAVFFANLIVFIWIMGMTYTVKILDGLDGLATGITLIGALMIWAVANGERWHQPDMALLALIFAGACLGFLFFNFSPAKIFLGEGGGLFLGYMLAVLSVISGGKFATALLVMAIPILDIARVLLARRKRGQPILMGDREHLHFWLLDRGWKEKSVVLFFYLLAFVFGAATLVLQSFQKMLILLFLLPAMGAAAIVMRKEYGKQR